MAWHPHQVGPGSWDPQEGKRHPLTFRRSLRAVCLSETLVGGGVSPYPPSLLHGAGGPVFVPPGNVFHTLPTGHLSVFAVWGGAASGAAQRKPHTGPGAGLASWPGHRARGRRFSEW